MTTTNEITIRSATESDLPTILSLALVENEKNTIWEYVFPSHTDRETDSFSSFRTLLEADISHRIADPDAVTLVATQNPSDSSFTVEEEIIATCTCARPSSPSRAATQPLPPTDNQSGSRGPPPAAPSTYISDPGALARLNGLVQQLDSIIPPKTSSSFPYFPSPSSSSQPNIFQRLLGRKTREAEEEPWQIGQVATSRLLSDPKRNEVVSELLKHISSIADSRGGGGGGGGEGGHRLMIKKYPTTGGTESLTSDLLLALGFRHVDTVRIRKVRENNSASISAWKDLRPKDLFVHARDAVGSVEIWVREPGRGEKREEAQTEGQREQVQDKEDDDVPNLVKVTYSEDERG
ncbi:hypothetical protein QBC43DRAFT_330634 [Cladorrhinum sp. PSN259]|nr:hypothetical protein QBC43DRAFT_330634 [Cladorrhinum sp. PSN259]